MPNSAAEMARQYDIAPKSFRQALRAENLSWHEWNARWNPPDGSPEHDDMIRVAERLRDRER